MPPNVLLDDRSLSYSASISIPCIAVYIFHADVLLILAEMLTAHKKRI
jgi:hypothetical protein